MGPILYARQRSTFGFHFFLSVAQLSLVCSTNALVVYQVALDISLTCSDRIGYSLTGTLTSNFWVTWDVSLTHTHTQTCVSVRQYET